MNSVRRVLTSVPKSSETASPENIGSKRITTAPTIRVPAVRAIGLNRTAPDSITASRRSNQNVNKLTHRPTFFLRGYVSCHP